MEFNCPIQYRIRGVKTGNASINSYGYRETVTIDLAEVEATDAPIAVEWKPAERRDPFMYGRTRFSDTGIEGPDGLQHTRWFMGCHWQRLCMGHLRFTGPSSRPTALLTPKILEEQLFEPGFGSSVSGVILGLGEELYQINLSGAVEDVESDPTPTFVLVKNSGRPRAMEGLERAAAQMIVVDNTLYRRSFEPFVSVKHRTEREETYLDISVEATPRQFWTLHEMRYYLYPLSRWREAVAVSVAAVVDDGEAARAVAAFEPTVLLDRSLTYDFDLGRKIGDILLELVLSINMAMPANSESDREIIRALRFPSLDGMQAVLDGIDAGVLAAWKKRGVKMGLLRDALAELERRGEPGVGPSPNGPAC